MTINKNDLNSTLYKENNVFV